jgi:DNA helicase-2/ATP-dependent DNA helicase PcrA
MSIPSRFLEEVPNQLVENLGGRSPAWSTPSYGSRASGYGPGRRSSQFSEFAEQHYNYEDESQEAIAAGDKRSAVGGAKTSSSKPFVASWMTAKAPASGSVHAQTRQNDEDPKAEKGPDSGSIDNIARFFGGTTAGGKVGGLKPGAFPRAATSRPPMEIPASTGAANLKKGQRVRHSKYGEGTILMREGEGEDAKLTVLFTRHGMKKLMEKFANLQKL